MFSAFSPLNGGASGTYKYPTESPFDLDAGLDYTRMPYGRSLFPYPLTIGYIEGRIPQFNHLEFSLMLGKLPTGPWQGAFPVGSQLPFMFPDITGGLMKVKG
jgi:hypothetical protein